MLIQLLLKLLAELFSWFSLSDPYFGLLLESYKFLVHFKGKGVSEKVVVFWSTRAFWKSIGLILLHWRHYCSDKFLVMGFLQAVSKLVLLKILFLLKKKFFGCIFVFFRLLLLDPLRLSLWRRDKGCRGRISPVIPSFDLDMVQSLGKLSLFVPLLTMKVFIVCPDLCSHSIPIGFIQPR